MLKLHKAAQPGTPTNLSQGAIVPEGWGSAIDGGYVEDEGGGVDILRAHRSLYLFGNAR